MSSVVRMLGVMWKSDGKEESECLRKHCTPVFVELNYSAVLTF